jgi:hypothetical protein
MIYLYNFNDYNLNENKVKKNERVEIFRNEKYIVIAPLSERASCKYGVNTYWCTAALSSGAFNSVENINTLNHPKLVYVIQIDYKISENNKIQSEEYYKLLEKINNDDFNDENEKEEIQEKLYKMENDLNSLNFSKIAVEYNPKTSYYNLWSANNINISESPWYYNINNLPIDNNVIVAIKKFCTEKN